MIYFFFYVIIIFLIWYLNRNSSFTSIFRTNKKTSWLVAGLSLFMLLASSDWAQIYSGIINKQGVWGLWLVWVTLISAAIVPIVFAPLWSKMNLITDNQFILFRFSGKGAIILHKFRAIYVGGIVVALTLSFQTIAFSRILKVFFDLSQNQAILITGGLLSIFSLKNTFSNKLKTDFFNITIYFVSSLIAVYYLNNYTGGFFNVVQKIKLISPDTLNIFPKANNSSFWYSIAVYLGVQWWSATMFDGGGPEMSRYTAVKSKWNAIKVGLTPILLNILVISLLVIMAILSYSMGMPSGDAELAIVENIFISIPKHLSAFIMLGFFALFITSSESILNWGASFLVVDFYKGYVAKQKSQKHYFLVSFVIMLFLSLSSMVFAIYIDNLESLIKVVFSISAGVTPVFILRWFWMRINAWSQLTAMISSGIYTLIFYAVQGRFDGFFEQSFLQSYEWRILIVTFLTTITWLAVTFLTPKDNNLTISKFKKILPSSKTIISSFIIAFAIGISIILFLVTTIYFLLN